MGARTARPHGAAPGRSARGEGEPVAVLVALLVVAAVFALAVLAIARLTLAVLRWLDVDPIALLLWLGLAEWPVDGPKRRERPRLAQLAATRASVAIEHR